MCSVPVLPGWTATRLRPCEPLGLRPGILFIRYVFCIKLLMLGRSPVDGLVRLDRLGSALFYYVFCIKLLICLGRSPSGSHGRNRV